MNRCTKVSPWVRARTRLRDVASHAAGYLSFCVACGAACCGLLLAGTAWAQLAAPVRSFPPNAYRAAFLVTQFPEVLINGQPDRLAPGVRIHDTRNMLALPGVLTGQPLLVNYVREMHGLVQEVWILTPEEAALTLPTMPPPVYGRPTDSNAY